MTDNKTTKLRAYEAAQPKNCEIKMGIKCLMGFDNFFLIVILFYLGSQSHGLFKCVTSGQETTEAQKGTTAQAGAVDPLVVIGAFDAKDADARADVDQHEGVDGGPDAVNSVQNLNLNFGHANKGK